MDSVDDQRKLDTNEAPRRSIGAARFRGSFARTQVLDEKVSESGAVHSVRD
jgi:hypothetical protein